MGVGPIPISKIEDRAEMLELFGDAADRFVTILRQMDGEYVSSANKTSKDKKTDNEVDADDTEGVKAIFTSRQGHGGRKHKK